MSKGSYGGIVVNVVGREVVGMTDRPSLIYQCDCGVKGTQGQLVRHLREDDGHPYTEISRALGVARYAWGKAEREVEREAWVEEYKERGDVVAKDSSDMSHESMLE